MNKEWSELNKTMQAQIKKKGTYIDGISTLFELRNRLMHTIISFKNDLSREDFNAIPFINADGYHSKTIAYSLWHIFRIEDIVAHTLINCDEQIFFSGNYKERINSPIITTGNELVKNEISDFSKQLDINELYSYISEVKERKLKYGEKMEFAKELFRQGKSIMEVNDLIDTGLGPLAAAYNAVLTEKGRDKDYKKIGRPNKYGLGI